MADTVSSFAPKDHYKSLLQRLPAAIKEALTVDSPRRAIVVKNVWIDGEKNARFDLDDLADAKRKAMTVSSPIYAEIELVDKKTGAVISAAKKMRIGDIPHLTPHESFLLGGTEYSVINQLRLRPGVYTHPKGNGELSTSFNLAKGRNFNLNYNNEANVLKVEFGHGSAPIVPLLHALGVQDDQIGRSLGQDFLNQNLVGYKSDETEIRKIARMVTDKQPISTEDAVRSVKAHFAGTEMDPEVNKITIGHASNTVDGPTLLKAAARHMAVYGGKADPDDRDSLLFKTIHSMDDLIVDKISHRQNRREIANKIKQRIDNFDSVRRVINSQDLTRIMNRFFLSSSDGGSGLVSVQDQTNPVQMNSEQHKITMMGEGGISSEHAVPLSSRYLHSSHFGIIDPNSSPDSGRVGTVFKAATGAVKIGNKLGAKLIDARTLKQLIVPISDFHGKVTALPDQFHFDEKIKKLVPNHPRVRAMKGGQIVEVDAAKVDYVVPSPHAVFSTESRLAPFLGAISGNRAMMGSKMIDQALPLKYAEAPIVRPRGTGGGKSVIETPVLGNARLADVDGIVTEVAPSHIMVKSLDGAVRKHGLYDHYPTQGNSLLHHTPLVKAGDEVKKGQVIADSNFTKNGELALGTHLNFAYLPYHGHAHEDGIVISESAAKKLTSQHLHVKEFMLDDDMTSHRDKFRAAFPGSISDDHAKRLDEDGVIKPGQDVFPNELLVAGLRKREPRPEDQILRRIGRKLAKPISDASVAWDGDVAGKVVRVDKLKDRIRVHVSTEEPMVVGDKMAGGAGVGDKGIVVKILSDDRMPRTKSGEPIHVLFNPFGIAGRVNPATLLESAAGKIARKTGKPYYADPFHDGNYVEKLQGELKQHGLSDKEDLYDPESGKIIHNIMVGPRHVMKLKHQVSSKYSARDIAGYDIDGQPIRGGDEGSKRTDILQSYAILSHGAKEVLADIAQRKSDKNDELWRSIKLGLPLPPPRLTFATNKWLAMMTSLGANVKKDGYDLSISPMTSKQILAMSNGEIKHAGLLHGEDGKEQEGGLLDPVITGGLKGEKFSHIKLAEKMPNPLLEEAMMAVTGFTANDVDDIVAGRKTIHEGKIVPHAPGLKPGSQALYEHLNAIDPAKEFQATRERLNSETNMTAINKLNKRARMLRGLIKFGEKPGDIYMIDHVPVLPPVFRPIYPLPNGQIEHSGLNGLYKDVMNINERVAAFKDMPPHQVEDLRSDMHEALHVLWGLKDGALSGRPYQGLVSIIKGRTSPKSGYFSKKLMARPMDTVGRSTIIPNPALHPDDIGLPENMAWKMFAPHVIGEMQKIGVSPLQATEEVEKRSSRAKSALLQVMANRQVLANRAPSLHKFSIMGFNPKLVDGDAIHMPPLVFKGFNADTDGDSMVGNIIIRDSGEVRVINIRDFPVQREYRHADGKILYEPKTGVEVLAVPGGVGPEWKKVEQFSRHSNLVMYRVKVSGVPSPLLLSEDSSMVTMDLKSDMRTRATKPQESMTKLVPVSYRVETMDVMPEAYDLEKGVATGYMIAAGFTRKKADGIGLVMPYRDDARKKLMKSIRIVFPGAPIERMKLSPAEFSRIVDSGIGKKVGGGRRGYFISGDMVHVLVKESFDPATFYLHFGAKSKAFKVGLAYGAALGMGSCRPKATKNTFNGFGHLHPASAFRFFCATAGIEIRFFRKDDQFTMLPGFMDIDSYAMWVAAEKAHGSAVFSSYTSSTRLYGKVLLVPKKTYGFDMEPKYIPVDYDLLKKSIAEVESAGAFKNSHVWRLAKLRFLAQDKKIHNACPLGLLLYFIGRMAKAAPAFERTTFWLYVQGSLSHECSYEIVTSAERLMEKMTAYDVSVEDAQVFCEIGGVSLKNTMMISAPISQRAVEEARSMHASQHLMNPGTGDLMMVPKNESMHGIYLMTRTGKITGKKYPTFDAALADHAAGHLDDTDVIKVGDMVTTPGRIKVNMTLPESQRNFATQFDAKAVRKALGDVARSSPKTYTDTAFNLKALGDEAGFTHGITIGLDDIAPPKRVRDGILNQASKKLALDRTPENARKIFVDSGLRDRLSEQLDAHYKDHPSQVWDMMKSGAFGKTDQGWQMIVAPVLINDGEGKPIPHPVTKSFSEGLNISDYWSTLYGQRKGMIDRALSTWEPGMINKEVVTAALGHTVSEADCGAAGSPIDLDDRSVFNRHLSSDLTIDGVKVGKRGDVINNAIVHSAKKAGMTKIDAGSMKSCEAMNGVCQHDAGRNERGEHYPIGFNIGAHAATTICEPLTQGVMQNFHKGGTSFSKTIRGLDRVRQLVELPQIVANSGAMSKVEGVVRKIDKLPSGDHRILISGGVDRNDPVTGKPNKVVELVPHSVGANMDLKVVEGQSVKRGQMISGGDPLPRDILDTQGIGAARDHIVNELHKTYKTGNNLDMDKRFFEVIAKVVSNHAYIDHPGDAKWHVKGDYLPLTRAHRMNAALTAKGLKPMTIHPELKGVVQVPMTGDDWVARLGGRYLKKSIVEAVSTGMSSNVGPSGHHVSKYAFGIHYNDPWPHGAAHKPGNVSGKGFDEIQFNGPISNHEMHVHGATPMAKVAGFKKK